MKDMVLKGRQSRGEDGRNKLTVKDIKQIRGMFREGDYTKQALADYFNVSRRLIFNIINKIAWKQV